MDHVTDNQNREGTLQAASGKSKQEGKTENHTRNGICHQCNINDELHYTKGSLYPLMLLSAYGYIILIGVKAMWMLPQKKSYNIHISIGVAKATPDIVSITDLIDKADKDLYRQKRMKKRPKNSSKLHLRSLTKMSRYLFRLCSFFIL